MTTLLRNFWQAVIGQGRPETQGTVMPVVDRPKGAAAPAVEIAPNDPLVAYFQSTPGAVEMDRLHLDSPGLQALKAAGIVAPEHLKALRDETDELIAIFVTIVKKLKAKS